MTDNDLACSILHFAGIAVLKRVAPMQYILFGDPPSFYHVLFPPKNDGPCVEPWAHSPMLEFFLEDAENFFEQKGQGSVSSGVWQEDGKGDEDTAMVAIATACGNTQIILIKMLQEEYSERVGILCKARKQLLESRTLSQHLEIFKEKSQFDGLTKIFNRATFMEFLVEEMRRSRLRKLPLSLLMLDIDNFKKVNDTYGHLTGDMVLKSLAAILTKTLRRNDIIARYGGEEFVVIIPHENLEQSYKIGAKLIKSIAEFRAADMPPFTVSMGCTSLQDDDVADSFLKRADLALYDAKRGGKNTVCVR